MNRSEDPTLFESRKKDHIKWSLSEESQTHQSPSSLLNLAHDAIPDLNFEDIKITNFSKHFTNHKPLMVSSMTGGHEDSFKINKILTSACAKKNWLFAAGSMRKELELIDEDTKDSEWLSLDSDSTPLIGNLGVAQVLSHSTESILNLKKVYSLKGLFVHLNPLQEVIQTEGTPQFKGALEKIKTLKKAIEIPLFLKETGTGLSLIHI